MEKAGEGEEKRGGEGSGGTHTHTKHETVREQKTEKDCTGGGSTVREQKTEKIVQEAEVYLADVNGDDFAHGVLGSSGKEKGK